MGKKKIEIKEGENVIQINGEDFNLLYEKAPTNRIIKSKPNNTDNNFTSLMVKLNFIYNEKFSPIIIEINKQFYPFFNKWCKLSKSAKLNEQEIREAFYKMIYYRLSNDNRALNTIDFINEATRKINGELSPADLPKEYQEIIIDYGLMTLKPIIDEFFEIPNLVLTSFEKSKKSYQQELKMLKRKYGGIKTSNPNEQKLFDKVWKINKIQLKENIKFSPFATFKKINDSTNLIDPQLIQPNKFSTSALYNRYKGFRFRKQKSEDKES